MKTSFRSKVFKRANLLMAITGKSFSVSLAKAWALYRLTKRMRNGVVLFAYERKDGTLRKAKGTLFDIEHMIKGTGNESLKTINYFDIESKSFRSFRIENFITDYKTNNHG